MSYAPFFIGVAGKAGSLTPEVAGSKAAQLSRINLLGLNVPPAFVLPTTLCIPVNRGDEAAIQALHQGLREGVARLEEVTGRRLGDDRAPLLVSVRSGAAQSMPGMLATILNVGLAPASVHGLIGLTGNPHLAWDSYRRFIQSYAEIVEGVPAKAFQSQCADMLRSEEAGSEGELDCEALERLSRAFHAVVARNSGRAIPDDPYEQLDAAARAVFRSWDVERAKDYRRLNKLEHLAGTAVTVQAMVFGNAGTTSGAGVAFSRNPATGAKELYVDFLFDAQGEDIVSGRRVPENGAQFATRLPLAAKALTEGAARLEREFRDLQDIEFTVEQGTLYFLQTRSAKRTPRAALRALVAFVREGLIDPAEALVRAEQIELDHVRITRFASAMPAVAKAVPASPGVASGRVAFDSARAKLLAASGTPVILARPDPSSDDIAGFAVSAGILTTGGGRTAHAAVVARQLGKVCLVGCRALTVYEEHRCGKIAGAPLAEGDWISLDGETGDVTLGRGEIVSELPEAELAEIENWRRSRSSR